MIDLKLSPWQYGIFAISILLSVVMTLSGGLMGSDLQAHLTTAKSYADGVSLGEFLESPGQNHFYPPLYHLLLALLYLAHPMALIVGAYLLQICLFPAFIYVMLRFVERFRDRVASVVTGGLLLLSYGVLDRALQAIPQTIDFVLFPLILWAFIEERYTRFVVLSTLALWLHAPFGLFFLSGMLLFTLWRGLNRITVHLNTLFAVFVLSLPVLFGVVYSRAAMAFLPGGLTTATRRSMFASPEFFFVYVGLPIVLIGLVAAIVWWWGAWSPKNVDLLMVCWAVGLVPLSFFMVDRFASYLAVPLAVFGGGAVSDFVKYLGLKT